MPVGVLGLAGVVGVDVCRIARLEVEYLVEVAGVEVAGDVQAEREVRVELLPGVNLVARQPAVRAEVEVHLVPVEKPLRRSDCRPDLQGLEADLVLERLRDVPLPRLELGLTVDVLPFAAAAGVRTGDRGSIRSLLGARSVSSLASARPEEVP